MPERYFTPAEANAMLPVLTPRVEAIRDGIRGLRELAERGHERTLLLRKGKIEELIRAEVEAIRAEGVEVKGLDPVLLDFPALMHGREVYLCWRAEEQAITHWHPTTTGFSGRKRLDPDVIPHFEWEN